ncbi:AraC family transcriptional regulator [Allostella vacuolata]|nr:AraC family transcriptional regulator [Stella vacuolata]
MEEFGLPPVDGHIHCVRTAGADLTDRRGWLAGLETEDLGNGCRVNRLVFTAVTEERFRAEGPPTICIAVFLDGRGSMTVDGVRTLPIMPGTAILFHSPRRTGGENRIAAGCRVRCVDVRFSPESLEHLGLPSLAALLRADEAGCSVQETLFLLRPAGPALLASARDALGCTLQGSARRLYLQAKAIEILSLMVALAETGARQLLPRDQRRVEEAARLVAERFQEPWTIGSLARAVGLNERKLKEGFRAVLGRTVHAHLEEVRLAAAAAMIQDGTAITEAAMAVGYGSPSHFAKVFRRRHGCTPRDWPREGAAA